MKEAYDSIEAAKVPNNLTESRSRSRDASNVLEAAGMLLDFCECKPAAGALFEASEYASRAANANSPDRFSDDFNRMIRSFNDAVFAIKRCSKN